MRAKWKIKKGEKIHFWLKYLDINIDMVLRTNVQNGRRVPRNFTSAYRYHSKKTNLGCHKYEQMRTMLHVLKLILIFPMTYVLIWWLMYIYVSKPTFVTTRIGREQKLMRCPEIKESRIHSSLHDLRCIIES